MKLRHPVYGEGHVYLQVGCEFGVRTFDFFMCIYGGLEHVCTCM